ncbi:unnamed protein product [Adineta ricciae]|uniref:poly(A)-specific ribonuclease n=1 Tax=Adineta ricciae TaxID=249248 RepID=A0A813MGD5_ADIRI|nr:unnamed protein product [Adineta ricciae]CAF0819096.1 unnamed protein product [Adineta ricciae]
MPGVSLNYHSSLSVDDTTSYSQRIHPPQQYYYQSIEQSTFYSYQSQLSLQSDHQQKSSTSSNGTKKCDWNELEVTGNVRNLSPILWTLSQLTVLYLNDNQLTRLPSEIACLTNLVTLDLSNNKLRNLPSEIGELISLRELNLTNNSIRNLPYELGKLFRLQSLGLMGNPLPAEVYTIYTESNGLQKLLTYFLDSLPSSLNGITHKDIASLSLIQRSSRVGVHPLWAGMYLNNRMCSITESRRVTVSCKHIFSSCTNECSTSASLFRTTKQKLHEKISSSRVFHVPIEQKNNVLSDNTRSLRTILNPLSPVFYSHHQTQLLSNKISFEHATSNVYQSYSLPSMLLYSDHQTAFSFSIVNNTPIVPVHRGSLASLSSSSSSSSSDTNNNLSFCRCCCCCCCCCDKENLPYRKRPRRSTKKSSFDNYSIKRIKTQSRTKTRKQRRNASLINFSIDLTGQNIDYTIEYHYYQTLFIPFYYDFYYLSWLQLYYYYSYLYFYYSQYLNRESIQPPPARSWIRLASPNATQPTAIFTIMNYNILCDKYATRHVYGYCPSWALKWDYRRKHILEELRSYSADIIALQVGEINEMETDQFHSFFLPELQKHGYDGVFSPKSRAKTMCEQDRRYVDGCAIFYRQSKFRLIKHYLVEFNQLAMSAANGTACHDMMNRVMTKDNIGLVAFLETKEEIYSHTFSNGVLPTDHKQMLFVCTAHIHWDPEYCDVKVVQTLMLLSELKTIIEDAIQKHRPNSSMSIDCSTVPLVLCGDFNSLPGSGVIELMRSGKISMTHADFKDLSYETYLQRYSRVDGNPTPSNDIVHHFKLQSAYETTADPIMPYTNFTYDFKGIIDYVFFSTQLMRVLGVLGPLDPEWLQTNKIVGCPHPNVPSDHFSLLVEFELNPSTNDNSKTSTTTTTTTAIPVRRQ